MSENTETTETTLDRKDLKIRALRETISNCEDRIADLRVDLTLHAQEVERLRKENGELYFRLQQVTPVEGEEEEDSEDTGASEEE